jgi:hypothetical protein
MNEPLENLQGSLPVLAPEEEASVSQIPDQTAQIANILALLEDVSHALLAGTVSPDSPEPLPLQEDLLSGLSAWLAAWWQTLPDTVQEQASAPLPPQQLPLPEPQTPQNRFRLPSQTKVPPSSQRLLGPLRSLWIGRSRALCWVSCGRGSAMLCKSCPTG